MLLIQRLAKNKNKEQTLQPDLFFFFFKHFLNVNKALVITQSRGKVKIVFAQKKIRSNVKYVVKSVCFFCCISTECSLAALAMPLQGEIQGSIALRWETDVAFLR